MKWVWKEIFSIDVPEGWEIREPGDLIELIPPESAGAAHISILNRNFQGNVDPKEAILLLKNFAEKNCVHLTDEDIKVMAPTICCGTFESEDNGLLCWEVCVHVWKNRAIVCSYCHDCSHQNLVDQATEIFASIRPETEASDEH